VSKGWGYAEFGGFQPQNEGYLGRGIGEGEKKNATQKYPGCTSPEKMDNQLREKYNQTGGST